MTIFIDIFKAKKSRWVDISYRVTAAPQVGALPGTALAQGVHRGGARAGGVVPAGSEVVLVQPVLPLQLLAAVLVGLVVHPGHHLGEHRHAVRVVVVHLLQEPVLLNHGAHVALAVIHKAAVPAVLAHEAHVGADVAIPAQRGCSPKLIHI